MGQQHSLQVIDAPKDCGNAPRKMVIRDFLVALYQQDDADVAAALRDNVRWEVIGSTVQEGLDEVGDWVRQQPPAAELHIATVLTHGTDCAADGRVVHVDGSTTHFSHMLFFTGHTKTAKIKKLRSYLIRA